MEHLFTKRRTVSGSGNLKKIGGSTILVLSEAERVGIEWRKIPYTDLFQLTYRGVSKYFHGQTPSETTEFAHYLCLNKRFAKNVLAEAGVSVSDEYLITGDDSREYLLEVFEKLQKPLVLKPVNDAHGDNVFLRIQNETEYFAAIEKIKDFYGSQDVHILVETMFFGDEYRVLATKDKILSVIKRIPANVVGDGSSTIEALVAQKNTDPIRNTIERYSNITVDATILSFLEAQGYSLQSVPHKDEHIFLREHSPLNISLGGDTLDVTDEIHSSVHEVIHTVMQNIPGLSLAGIDFMCDDITRPLTADSYIIIELNDSPSLDWNAFPLSGKSRPIAFEFLKIMYPELESSVAE